MGHSQPPTPIHCDNATVVGIANKTVKKHRSGLMEMRYFYSCEKVRRGNFNVQYHPGLECLGDYPTHPLRSLGFGALGKNNGDS